MTPIIETPFGWIEIEFRATTGSRMGPGGDLDAARGAKGTRIRCWSSALFELQIMTGPADPRLPYSLTVDECIGAVWRVHASFDLEAFDVSCGLPDAPLEGSPETGQHLECQTWSHDGRFLALGTEDDEALWLRAERGIALPRRLAGTYFRRFEANVRARYDARGITVAIPAIRRGEVIGGHFVAAWAPESKADQGAWYAVDWVHEKLCAALSIGEA
ncbi:MAG: hypothetical protein U0610_15050 [bacterium]